jgi:hypothetical protein
MRRKKFVWGLGGSGVNRFAKWRDGDPEDGYRVQVCTNCGRMRIEMNGVCDKCGWDQDGGNFASITRMPAFPFGAIEVVGTPTLPRGGKAQDVDLPDRFGELPERTRPSIFDGQPPLTEEDMRGYSKEQWAEIIAGNKGGLDGVEAGGAAGEDRRTVEAVSKGDDGVESGAVGVGEKKGVDG